MVKVSLTGLMGEAVFDAGEALADFSAAGVAVLAAFFDAAGAVDFFAVAMGIELKALKREDCNCKRVIA